MPLTLSRARRRPLPGLPAPGLDNHTRSLRPPRPACKDGAPQPCCQTHHSAAHGDDRLLRTTHRPYRRPHSRRRAELLYCPPRVAEILPRLVGLFCAPIAILLRGVDRTGEPKPQLARPCATGRLLPVPFLGSPRPDKPSAAPLRRNRNGQKGWPSLRI